MCVGVCGCKRDIYREIDQFFQENEPGPCGSYIHTITGYMVPFVLSYLEHTFLPLSLLVPTYSSENPFPDLTELDYPIFS